MNCKQGDIAVIVKSPFAPQLVGRVVEVLYAAPVGADFRLPNGRMHDALTPRLGFRWVCEFHNPIAAPSTFGPIETIYAPVPDDFLRPIRDNDGEDEMLRTAGLPNKQPEVAL